VRFFDSLTHVTRDGRWFGETSCDASVGSLIGAMDAVGSPRACLVAIADFVDNEIVMSTARAYPGRFVPIAGLNPHIHATTRRVEVAVRKIKALGFAGIKLHPRLNGYDPLDPKMIAALDVAGEVGLVVFLDTLFRQRGRATRHAPDVVDYLASACPDTKMLLLHGTGPTMMELYEIVRCNDNLLLDLSFTILRYKGNSRLDCDMNFLMKSTDRLMTIGSDFPEFSLAETLRRFEDLAIDVDSERRDNLLFRNLEKLFAGYALPREGNE